MWTTEQDQMLRLDLNVIYPRWQTLGAIVEGERYFHHQFAALSDRI
jgi:hypothetical protein